MNTKQVEILSINDEDIFQAVVNNTIVNLAKEEAEKIDQRLQLLYTSISNVLNQEWVKMKNKPVFYNHTVLGLFPDFSNFELGECTIYYSYKNETFSNKFANFTGQLLKENELRSIFIGNIDKLNKRFGWKLQLDCCYTILGDCAIHAQNHTKYSFGGSNRYPSYHIPIYRLGDKMTKKPSVGEVLLQWLKHDLIPDGLDSDVERAYMTIHTLYNANNKYFSLQEGELYSDQKQLMQDFINQRLKPRGGTSLDAADVASMLKAKMPITLPSDALAVIKNKLLTCDYERCDLEKYDEKILTDPNRGHWDLWETADSTNAYTVQVNEVLMARNPLADINYDGVVGIDFGTKSTVVVYQESSDHTMPMRIGTGRFSQKVENHHYENPTVLEFIDIDAFLNQYREAAGRPQTSWQDLTTSHTAFNSLLNSHSEEYYAYLYELKQWAGDSKRHIRLRDKQGKDLVLPAFLSIEAGA